MSDQMAYLIQEEPRGPSQLIEIPITTAQQNVKLPQIQELMSVDNQIIVIKALRLITFKVVTTTPTGATNAPLGQLQIAYLVLWSQGWIKGQQIPLLTLNDMVDADSANATTVPYRNRTTRLDDWKKVDWNKSTIQFGVAPTPTYSILLEVEYQRYDLKGNIIEGPA